jgi:hypothetical protein
MTNNKIKKKNNSIKNQKMIKYQEESSILGNTYFIGFILFSIQLILFSIIHYVINISNPYWLGILAFITSTIISILYYTCQRRKKCKIRMIVNIKNN